MTASAACAPSTSGFRLAAYCAIPCVAGTIIRAQRRQCTRPTSSMMASSLPRRLPDSCPASQDRSGADPNTAGETAGAQPNHPGGGWGCVWSHANHTPTGSHHRPGITTTTPRADFRSPRVRVRVRVTPYPKNTLKPHHTQRTATQWSARPGGHRGCHLAGCSRAARRTPLDAGAASPAPSAPPASGRHTDRTCTGQ